MTAADGPRDVASRVAEAVLTESRVTLEAPVQVEPVGGGHSWLTHVVTDATGRRVVVRVAPPGGTMSPYDPAFEARAVRAAGTSVPAPAVLDVVAAPNLLDAGYAIHEHVEGRVLRLSAVPASDRERHRDAFATVLGRLHAGADPAVLDREAAAGTTTEALRRDLGATAAAFARGAPNRHPGFTVGLRWLATHLPDVADPPRLCHGDFRFHNLAWAGTEIAAVLDWERAWVGDPLVDVAFTRRFSGWCAVDGDATTVYERAAGVRLDPARLVYGDHYEWVRSSTSGVRGWHALAHGRDDALALYGIGEAGWTGAWRMVDLLDDGPLDAAVDDGLAARPRPPFPPGRLAALADLARAAGDDVLADHLDGDAEADACAVADSVAALRRVVDGPGVPGDLARQLVPALDHPDPPTAWDRAHEVLADAVLTGGPELVAPLHALGRRHTTRATLLPLQPPPEGSP